jgi:hypothetical protein
MSVDTTGDNPVRNDCIRIVSTRLFYSLAALLVAVALCVAVTWKTGHSGTAFIVMFTGAIGGFIGLQQRLTDLPVVDLQLLVSSRLFSSLAPFVGAVLALLLYLLFLSELLKGDLFPKFVADPDTLHRNFLDIFLVHGEDYRSYAKVVVWSFIAGYSERFVIDIIGKLSDKKN